MVIFRRILTFLCLISVCFAQHSRKCADVPIKTTDGKILHIPQYRGKAVMIVMFSTTCDHCLVMLELARRMQQELGPHGLQTIAISIDDTDRNVQPYAQRYRFPFPVGYLTPEPALQLADMKKGEHPIVPLVIFVNWQGDVHLQYNASDPIFNQGEKGIRQIASALCRQAEEKQAPVLQTKPAAK
jgi:thiol-disulfide isomerase/thioredoxin